MSPTDAVLLVIGAAGLAIAFWPSSAPPRDGRVLAKKLARIPWPVSHIWWEPREAYMLIRNSSLVAPPPASFEDMENPDWEAIQDSKEASADVIASMHLEDFKMECPDAVRDGKYGLQTLRWWIGRRTWERLPENQPPDPEGN